MGISRSELFPGFNRCIAKWKSPLIRSIAPEPDHRHSAQRQQRAHNVSAFCTSWMQGDTLGKSERLILSKSLMKPITNLCSQLNIAPPTLFSIWQMIISSKWIWPSFRNEDLHLRDKSHSALCKLSFALVNDKLQEAEYDNYSLPKAGARTILLKW